MVNSKIFRTFAPSKGNNPMTRCSFDTETKELITEMKLFGGSGIDTHYSLIY